MPLPVVAIVGRPNVGKSSLFNALIRSRVSIVDPRPGVTRDRVSVVLRLGDKNCELVDTGGIGIVDEQGLEHEIEAQIEIAMRGADLLLFTLDTQQGMTGADRAIAQRLRKLDKPIVLVANKADTPALESEAAQFFEAGFGEPVCTATVNGRGIGELRERIFERLPQAPPIDAPADAVRIAVVGRTNSGKSTLVNRIVGSERMIVSDVPGTTRDSVDLRFDRGGRAGIVVDTAGLRKEGAISGSPDFYAQARAERAIRRCDVALFLIDALRPIGRIEHSIAKLLLESYRPFVIVLTKWDQVTDRKFDEFGRYVRDRLDFLSFAPITCLSAQEDVRVGETIDLALSLHDEAGKRLGTGDVMRMIKEALERRGPPVRGGRTGKIFYAAQVDIRPPTFVLFVNEARLVSQPYLRWLANVLRDSGSFAEIPIRFLIRERVKNVKR